MNDALLWSILVSMAPPYVYILAKDGHTGADFTGVVIAQVIVFFLTGFILQQYF